MGNTIRNNRSAAIGLGVIVVLAAIAMLLLASNRTGPASASIPETVFAVLEDANAAKSDVTPIPGMRGDLNRGRVASSRANGSKILLFPDGNDVCISPARGKTITAQACGTIDQALSGDVVGVVGCLPDLPNGTARFFGITPNGVTKVSYVTSGETTTAESGGNTFTFDSSEIPKSITFTSSDGKTSQASVPQVPGGLLENCAGANGK